MAANKVWIGEVGPPNGSWDWMRLPDAITRLDLVEFVAISYELGKLYPSEMNGMEVLKLMLIAPATPQQGERAVGIYGADANTRAELLRFANQYLHPDINVYESPDMGNTWVMSDRFA